MNETVHPRDLRVGADEREHVVALLQKAVGRGLLDIDEFTARSDAALTATTRAELNAVLVDLPGAETIPDRLEVAGSWVQKIDRGGRWPVPRELVVRNRWNPANLDFTTARFLHDQVRVVLDTTGGPVTLRLPAGAGVSTSALTVTWGATVLDRRSQRFRQGMPQFTVGGTLRAAPLVIEGPG